MDKNVVVRGGKVELSQWLYKSVDKCSTTHACESNTSGHSLSREESNARRSTSCLLEHWTARLMLLPSRLCQVSANMAHDAHPLLSSTSRPWFHRINPARRSAARHPLTNAKLPLHVAKPQPRVVQVLAEVCPTWSKLTDELTSTGSCSSIAKCDDEWRWNLASKCAHAVAKGVWLAFSSVQEMQKVQKPKEK